MNFLDLVHYLLHHARFTSDVKSTKEQKKQSWNSNHFFQPQSGQRDVGDDAVVAVVLGVLAVGEIELVGNVDVVFITITLALVIY